LLGVRRGIRGDRMFGMIPARMQLRRREEIAAYEA
jgi:hypothetical protein